MTQNCVHGSQILKTKKWAGRAIMNEIPVIWSWGANSYGQLAQGHNNDQLVPTEVKDIGLTVRSITGGGGHTLTITDCGELWTCGSNNKGQLGLGHTEDILTLTRVTVLQECCETVVMATGGWDFSLAVTGSGKLFCWGSNAFGQLGDPKLPVKCHTPTQVHIDDGIKVMAVTAGLRHSAALTEDGDVYCWGHAKKGQCGSLGGGTPQLKCQTPVKVPLPKSVGRVKLVVAGSYHTAALTDESHVIVWGCNKYGQTTQDPTAVLQVIDPYLVPLEQFGGARITHLDTGWTHFIAQTVSGDLYSWGRGDYGQLGREMSGGHHIDPCPGKILTQEKILDFVCGSEHTLFVTENRRLCAVGWNEHGLCGTGDEVNVNTVTPVNTFSRLSVSSIGCGGGHCFAITIKSKNSTAVS